MFKTQHTEDQGVVIESNQMLKSNLEKEKRGHQGTNTVTLSASTVEFFPCGSKYREISMLCRIVWEKMEPCKP